MKKFIRVTSLICLLMFWVPNTHANVSSKHKVQYEGPEIEVDIDELNENDFFMMDMDYAINSGAGIGHIPDGLPCEGIITSNFGWRKISKRRARMHLGTDIAGPIGTLIYAPAAGRVNFSGVKNGYGNTIVLDHGNNLSTLYGHNSELLVKEGQWVEKGQAISKMGSTGHSTGPHLHYEVRISGTAVNPRKFF